MNILNIRYQDLEIKYDEKILDAATLHAKKPGPKLFAQAEDTGSSAGKNV